MGKAAQGFLVLVIVVFACSAMVTLIGKDAYSSQFTDECNEIQFVQPSGIFSNRDQQYAEHVNEPNSRARLNCSKGEQALASATMIAAQAEVITKQSEVAGISKGVPLGILLTCTVGGIILFIIGLFFFMVVKQGQGDMQ